VPFVKAFVVVAALEPLRVQVTDRTTWVFAKLRSAEGLVGLGEGSLEGRADAVSAAIERLGQPLIETRFGAGHEAARWTMARLDESAGLVEAAALSAIEQALHDLIARSRGERLAESLGAVHRDPVPMYANINRGTTTRQPGQFAERALRAARQGFGGVKLAPFDNLTPDACDTAAGRALIEAGLARVAAVREAFDSHGLGDRSLMVDCHWRFSDRMATDMIHELAALRVNWYECPVPETPDHFDTLKRLRSAANARGMRLAGAELMVGLQGFLPILRAGLYDVVMPDVKYVGGLEETLRVAAAAVHFGAQCSPHNPSGPICHAQSLHVASVIPNMPLLEVQFEETPRFVEIADAGLPGFVDGASALPAGPGLGVTLA
jgi:galactonate dehydratase